MDRKEASDFSCMATIIVLYSFPHYVEFRLSDIVCECRMQRWVQWVAVSIHYVSRLFPRLMARRRSWKGRGKCRKKWKS